MTRLWLTGALLGGCICEPGGIACGGACVDLLSDPAHCGECWRSCGEGGTCLSGHCIAGPECERDSDCDDGYVCNGEERCGGDQRCDRGVEVTCNDDVACTVDECVEPTGECESTPDHDLCEGDDRCIGAEAGPTGCRNTCGFEAGCDLIRQCGCDAGETCHFVGEVEPACVVSGSARHGEPCGAGCAGGHECAAGICRRICDDLRRCTGGQCARELALSSGEPSGIRVCTTQCGLSPQEGCPAGTGCHYVPYRDDATTDCAVVGTREHGQSCSSESDCVAGTVCVNFPDNTRCARICRSSGYCDGDCVYVDPPLIVNGYQYGVCAS